MSGLLLMDSMLQKCVDLRYGLPMEICIVVEDVFYI